MNITTNDLAILVGMFLTLVLTNFMFASAGATGDQVNESDVPTLNLSADRFGFAGDRPERPIGPKQFRVSGGTDTAYQSFADLNETHTVDVASGSGGGPWTYGLDDSGSQVDSVSLTDNGSAGRLQADGWVVEMVMENNQTGKARGTILSSPEGATGFLSGFIGGTAEAIQGVWNSVVYLAGTFIWVIAVFIESIFNVVGLFVDLAGFGISLLGYMFSRYGTIQSQASGWAHLILLMPMIVIGAIFLKIGLALIDASNWI